MNTFALETLTKANMTDIIVLSHKNREGLTAKSGDGLATAVKRISGKTDGRLNPTFVEWFMQWPIGSTAFSPLAMDKFQEWQSSHGIPYTKR